MTRSDILDRIAMHLGEVLDLEDVKLTEASTAEDFEEWDSVNHVRLLIRIEHDLGFQFNTEDVGMVQTVGELVDLIAARQPKA
ncbi:acyl carrier protein [Aestuariivirga sp.]|uniref:acyl carrier protein n=1 Tax=Aestuariivirga sp. TaxID=2650926 RepID=UPI003594732D